MTETEDGRCLIIPIGLAGIWSMWFAAVVLVAVGTFGGPEPVRVWGILAGIGAATWTVVSVVVRQRKLLVYAFEVGRETGERSMKSVP